MTVSRRARSIVGLSLPLMPAVEWRKEWAARSAASGKARSASGIDSTRAMVPSPKPTVIVVIHPSRTSADASATTIALGNSARGGSSPTRWYDTSTVAVLRSSAMNEPTASPTGSMGTSDSPVSFERFDLGHRMSLA